jgi:ribosomal-protein-alanine N-acetyltransferase
MIAIRLMREQDIPEIVTLENHWNYLSKWGEQGYRAAISNSILYTCFVAEVTLVSPALESSQELAGLAILAQLFDHSELCNIIVSPRYQSQGVGQELLQACINLSEKLGLPRMLLEVRKSNTRAIRFYEHHGFHTIAERKDYYSNPTEHAWVMEKEIGPPRQKDQIGTFNQNSEG